MSEAAVYDQTENPYRSSLASAALLPASSGDDPQELLLQAYVGRKSAYFLGKWAARLADPAGEVGMNWMAFLLTSLWFSYRKMYVPALVSSLGMLAFSFIVQLFFIFMAGKAAPPAINLIVNLLIALVCGLYGNLWYLNQAQRTIASCRRQGMQGDELLLILSQRGGTSMLAVFAIIGVNVLAMLIGGFMMVLVAFAFFTKSV